MHACMHTHAYINDLIAQVWMEADVVSLKARLGELGATEGQMEEVLAKLTAI